MKKILIIDDDDSILKFVKTKISKEGYEIYTLNQAENAMDLIKKYNYDCILSDIHMPIIDGYELLKLIREKYSSDELPVLMFTQIKKETDDIVKLYNLGANDFVEKPINFPVLIKRIEFQIKLKDKILEINQQKKTLEEKNRDLELADKEIQCIISRDMSKLKTKILKENKSCEE